MKFPFWTHTGRRLFYGFLLSLSLTATAGVRINEFLTANDGGLRDQDNDSPDWIELRNESPAPVNLAGWHLTDTPTNLTKWTFPATNLASAGHLIVFASGKDRATNGGELHTSFQLSQDGGYLALVQPDGVTVAHAITYPQQRANVSFGPGRQVTATTLLATGAAARVFVPSNAALGLAWTASTFDDSGWLAATTPVGFNATPSASVILSIDFNERATNAAIHTQPGFQSFVINSNGSATAIQIPATTRSFGGLTVTVSNTAPLGYDDRGRPTPVDSGAFTESLLLRDFIFSREASGTGGLDVTINGLMPNRGYRMTVWSFDSGSTGNRAADWSANGVTATNNYAFSGANLPAANTQYRFTFETASDGAGRILLRGRRNPASVNSGGTADLGVFLNAFQVAEITAAAVTNTLGTLMLSNNASAYVRVPFPAADPEAVSELVLRVRYDDGFVAYLNGQLVASRQAPALPAWNASATAAHSAAEAEEIAIIPPPGLLVMGDNVLALHGLNVSAVDLDFSLGPELIGQQITETAGRFYTPPTPGVANGPSFDGLVADTRFSVDRGFYDVPFSVAITSATAGAAIYWTTNGSAPSPGNGTLYTAPAAVNGTRLLRAAAFKAGCVPSDVDTHTYVFLDQVLQQAATQPGYPTMWQGNYPADYGMDATVVNHPAYGATIRDDLRAIPTLSIVTEFASLWDAASGIYIDATRAGDLWERAASVELFDGANHSEFQINCGLRTQGNASRDNARTPKHSFRLLFKSEYGPSKLEYDWFSGAGAERFDNIVLRAGGFVDGWPSRYSDTSVIPGGGGLIGLRYRPETSTYLRDVWVKTTHRDLGWPASRSDFVHLYVNGLYWGLYNPCERLDASFTAARLGGREEDWDVLVGGDTSNVAEVVDGSTADWNQMMAVVNAGITNETAYQAVRALVDVPNLIDYMLLHIYVESEDWPHHNWYAAHRRATNGMAATPWTFLTWDQELSLDRLVRRNRIDVGTAANQLASPARIYAQLRAWPEFRREFGDRLHRHLFNGGALTASNNVARMQALAARIDQALVGESARWGDAREFTIGANPGTGQTFTPNEWWVPELQKLYTNFFQTLNATNLARFRAGGLYPTVGAPEFSQFGGSVSNGFALLITQTNAGGTIYYTVNGTDPREYGTGNVDPTALSYAGAIAINGPSLVRARVRVGTGWSALVEAFFVPPQDFSRLAITEIMYNPPDVGATDGDTFEFVELKNTGASVLDLSGLQFSSGINYTFPLGSMLAPGGFWVVVRNTGGFVSRHPGVAWQGVFTGRLANEGETLTVSLPFGGKLFSVDYGDALPWPLTADGFGFSLVPRAVNPMGNSDNGASWRASTLPGGSPGADDPAPVIPSVIVNELLANSVLPAVDAVELHNPTAGDVNVGGWFLSDDASAPGKFRIPDGTMIPAGGFVVFTETNFNSTPGTNTSFAFSARGEGVFLYSGDANTNFTGYSHGFVFGASDTNASFGRHVNSVDEEDFTAQTAASFSLANPGPRLGPVLISEIHYHPPPARPQFIELSNLGSEPVLLYDPAAPTNRWKLTGLNFIFPPGFILPANGVVVLASTNGPAFRTHYILPADVPVLEFIGQLQADGERLELQRPGPPDTNGVPYVTVDMVRYNDRLPWPPAADGGGASLQRVPAAAYGNDPAHWLAATPTPGELTSTPDSDGDGLPDSWEIANGTDPNQADSADDPDGDGFSNAEEYQAGTNPFSAASYLEIVSAAWEGGGVQITFEAAASRTYSVGYRSSLNQGAWTHFVSVDAQPANRLVTVTNFPAANATRFYRVVTPAAP